MSDAVIRRKINMPESTIIQLNTRSCNRSNRARVGRGATSTRSCSSPRKELLDQLQKESQRKPVGAGYFFNRFFGITGNFMFNQLGIIASELTRLNVPDGNGRVYTLTVDPALRLLMGQNWSV
jgi:hypothetical protein